jgi:phosphoglycerate dehydrogenase-like enzyme
LKAYRVETGGVRVIPPKDSITICFAHVAYRLQERFLALNTGMNSFEVRDREALERRLGEADVLVVSGLWQNRLLERAARLRFIQSIGAGTDQFSYAELAKAGIRLASARGVNARAVSEHAMALILALNRRLGEARDNQAKRVWRGMIGGLGGREDELGGKTLLIAGLGQIGGRLAQLAEAFDMQVIGLRRNPPADPGQAFPVHGIDELKLLLPQADFVALCCPLTPETENLIDAEALSLMKPSAYLINVARGRCVDEAALVRTLSAGSIAGAGIDVTVEEPLPPGSPLWAMEQVLITPHTAGETRRYEDNVLAILLENLDRLWRGEASLRNQVV